MLRFNLRDARTVRIKRASPCRHGAALQQPQLQLVGAERHLEVVANAMRSQSTGGIAIRRGHPCSLPTVGRGRAQEGGEEVSDGGGDDYKVIRVRLIARPPQTVPDTFGSEHVGQVPPRNAARSVLIQHSERDQHYSMAYRLGCALVAAQHKASEPWRAKQKKEGCRP